MNYEDKRLHVIIMRHMYDSGSFREPGVTYVWHS